MAKSGLARLLSGRGARGRASSEEEAAHNAAALAAEEDEDQDEPAEGEEGDDENQDESAEGEEEDDEEDMTSGATASGEKARIKAILGAPEAKGRESLAQHLALETTMSAAAAVAVLKASPAETKGRLAALMKGVSQPHLGAGGGAAGDESADQAAKRMAGYVNPRRATAG